jgi:hypothetical protein
MELGKRGGAGWNYTQVAPMELKKRVDWGSAIHGSLPWSWGIGGVPDGAIHRSIPWSWETVAIPGQLYTGRSDGAKETGEFGICYTRVAPMELGNRGGFGIRYTRDAPMEVRKRVVSESDIHGSLQWR